MRRPNRKPNYDESINFTGSTIVEGSANVTARIGETILIKAAITITLPANPPSKGVINIVNTGNYKATVDGNGNTIDGNTTITMRFAHEVNKLFWDGSEWYIT